MRLRHAQTITATALTHLKAKLTSACLLAGGRLQTDACAHALLPLAALTLFRPFDLRQHRTEWLAPQLSHLHVQQGGNDRDQRHDEDIHQSQKLLINLFTPRRRMHSRSYS